MTARVAIIMGSKSDWPVMQNAAAVLDQLEVPYDKKVVSAHRTPERLYAFATTAHESYSVIIAGAGGAAHLPGMAASMTHLPVIGVPVTSKALNGVDSLLSIVQMPKGVAVSTQSIGESGAFNAGLTAAQILALGDDDLRQRVVEWRAKQTESVSEAIE